MCASCQCSAASGCCRHAVNHDWKPQCQFSACGASASASAGLTPVLRWWTTEHQLSPHLLRSGAWNWDVGRSFQGGRSRRGWERKQDRGDRVNLEGVDPVVYLCQILNIRVVPSGSTQTFLILCQFSAATESNNPITGLLCLLRGRGSKSASRYYSNHSGAAGVLVLQEV